MPFTPLSNFSFLKKEAFKQTVTLDGHLFCGINPVTLPSTLQPIFPASCRPWAPPHVLYAVLQKDPD